MKKTFIYQNKLYAKAIKHGDILWIAGHIVPTSGKDIIKEILAVLDSLEETLKAAEYTVNNIVKVIVYLKAKNQKQFDTLYTSFNPIYVKWLEGHRIKEGEMPTRTLVGVMALPKGALLEVEAYAQK